MTTPDPASIAEKEARTQSFTDDKGNRFIFPGLIIWPDGSGPSGSDLILRAMTLSQALRVKLDADWLRFDPTAFPHIVASAGHRNFAHGSEDVWLFAGPEFDAVRNHLTQDTRHEQ